MCWGAKFTGVDFYAQNLFEASIFAGQQWIRGTFPQKLLTCPIES